MKPPVETCGKPEVDLTGYYYVCPYTEKQHMNIGDLQFCERNDCFTIIYFNFVFSLNGPNCQLNRHGIQSKKCKMQCLDTDVIHFYILPTTLNM